MKKLTTALMAVPMTLMFANSAFAELSPNLLLNSGAEKGDASEWSVSNFDVYTQKRNLHPHGGTYAFFSDSVINNTGRVAQTVDVSTYASDIDTGNAQLKAGGWMSSETSSECELSVQYFEEQGGFLSENTTGKVACTDAPYDWHQESLLGTIPTGTRTITLSFRFTGGYSYYIGFDSAYFYVDPACGDECVDEPLDSEGSDCPTCPDCPTISPTSSIPAGLYFSELQPLYHVGETVVIDLVENLQVSRFHRVDLWVVIKMPNGNLLFMTELAFNPFSLNPQPFRSSLDTTQTTHRVLKFEVLPGLGGDYTFYAVYVEEGKNPMTDSFLVLSSNMAKIKVVLSNE
jgi:hypothetical protein